MILQYFSKSSKIYLEYLTPSKYIITAVIALFVVIDPMGNIPLFIALTKKLEKEEHKTVSKTAILTAGILLVILV